MRLVSYRHPATGNAVRAGLLQGDRVLDVNGLTDGKVGAEMLRALDHWDVARDTIEAAAESFARDHDALPELPTNVAVPIWEAILLAPVPQPRSLRDFYAFERHVVSAYEKRGRPVPPAWYEMPVFYFGNHGSVIGSDEPIFKPQSTSELDFEMELAVVIGVGGRNIPAGDAMNCIAGFSLLNDWSARDTQRREMTVGLGPAKGKDFATSLGPWLVTPDELGDALVGGRLHTEVVVRVNGEELGRSSAGNMHWSFGDLIAIASRDVELRPGDVIGSGTLAAGCLLELGTEIQPWLEAGDVVEIEAAGLGRLRNRVELADRQIPTDRYV